MGNGQDYIPEKDSSSIEHGKEKRESDIYNPATEYAIQTDERYNFDVRDIDHVQRTMKQRHVQMIAIAGTIGTGLFLGSGLALATAGPLGSLIAYALVGTVAFATISAVGEMTAHAPISGTFPHFASRWVDPALGFALGWDYYYTQAIALPSEMVASAILLTFWDKNADHQPIYLAVLCLATVVINFLGAKYFGESEFFFSSIKLILITGLIIGGLAVSLGGGPNHDRIGFRYWKKPGPIAEYIVGGGAGRFCAIVSAFIQAGFSFQGMELVAIAASETKHPRRNIAKAVKRVFYRIFIFYILGLIITSMLVSSADPALLKLDGTAATSPYVIAFNNAGVKVLPHIINAAVFSSAFSAGNSFLYSSSRILYGLSLRGQAPKLFARCTSGGVPIVAVVFTSLFSWLSFLSVSNGPYKGFVWLQNLSTVGGLIAWACINITYLRFYAGMRQQGIDRQKLYYFSSLQPYLSIWGTFIVILIILINGFNVFFPGKFTAAGFLTAYINIPLFFALYFGWKLVKRTRFWRASEMDFWTGVPSVEETEGDYVPPTTTIGKIIDRLI